MQYEKDLLCDQFPDCQHKRLDCNDFIVNNYYSQQPYSAAISFNNEILVIGHYNSYTFIDLITRDSQLIIVNNTSTQKIITSIEISYYNHYIVLGTQIGDCYIQPIFNSPKELTLGNAISMPQFMPNTVRNIFTTSADFIILISISVIRVTTHDQMIEGQMYCKEQIQPHGVTAAIYNYDNDSLIVALGDSSIIIYDMKGLEFEELFTLKQERLQINLDCYEIINKLSLSEDARLLGVASCYLIGDKQYRVDIIDLKRKGKVIRKLKFDRANEVKLFHFLPFLNCIFIIDSDKNIFIESFDMKEASQENELSTTYQEEIKFTFLLSKVVPYPNILFITNQGIIQQISFLAEKTNHLYQLPYMYFVEAKLQQTLNYNSLMKQYFQSTFQSGLLETDVRQSVLLGESYFQPLFETVMRLSEFKKYFTFLYEERQKLKKRRYQLPLWIASWAFQAAYQKVQNFPPPPPLLLQKQQQSKKTKGKKKVGQLNQLKMKYTVEFDNKDQEKKQLLQSFGVNCNLILKQQEELNVMDDRFLIIYKLINNIEIQNLSMVMLQNCSILFDKRLKFINLMIDTINEMDKINYLDLSYNNLTIYDLRKINRLAQLKYLNIAGNNLGNIQKRKIKKINLQTEFDEKSDDNTTLSFYELLFSQIEMINLRDNNYSDEEGVELMELLERSDGLRLLDISGNSRFHNLTKDAVSQIIQGNKMKKQELSQLLMIEFNSDILEGTMKQLTNQYLKRFLEIPILYQKYVEKQAEIQELNFAKYDQMVEAKERKSQQKRNVSSQGKRKSQKKRKEQVVLEEVNQEQMELEAQSNEYKSVSECQFYLYIVNSQQKYEWDYSLLTLYERSIENQEDEIRNCVYKMFQVCLVFFVHQYENVQANFLNCLNQIFCSIFFIQKYLICCYCVFLTSKYGSWITSLLGIKTADYEYNDKKDQLQKYLENKKILLNLFFWLNYFIFYTIVIFVPIKFVLKCEGHEWTGHLIFCGYAAVSFCIEVLLSWICHKHNITHPEFETGPVWKRVMFFLKDTTLSLIARFDVYSDVCFITTVVECGDGNGIGIVAIVVMSISIFTTSYDVFKLLLSKQVGDQNYIDFLCNYCSFVEINLVSSLLEKWTIQNTSNFLCFKGLPNRIYAATFRTFAEDIPQFFLQVIYLLMNPNKTEIEILMLSLASSAMSTLLSITKSVTITKANRINDKVMMNQVKTKLKLQKQVQDLKYNDTIIQFLHDYYEVFDGEEHQESANYGVIDFKLAKITRNKDVDKYRTVKEHKIRQYKLRGVSMLEEQKQIIKGMTKKYTNVDQELNIEEMFEPYVYFIHSFQDAMISKMWSEQVFTQGQIAKVLLELEMSQYINVNQITSEKESYQFESGGSFIECLKVQAIILDQFYTHVTKNQIQNLTILDLGCGYAYTTTAILKLIESNAYVNSFKFICIDHHQQILKEAESLLKIGYCDLLQNKLIEFIQLDCKEDLQQFGQFDIINVGFAIRDAIMLEPLLKNQGIAIYPQISLPQDHDYYALIKADNQFETIDLNLQSQSGDFIPKELQDPELFQYFEVTRGSICKLCQNQLEQMQFYSPWLNEHYCLSCGQIDDEILDATEFKILSNLIFIPFNASEIEMKKISAYKFGKNRFPRRDQRATKYHAINCHPCQREIGEEQEYRPAPRYICMNCRSGKFDGQHLDFCHDCAKEFMEETYEYEYKLESVPGHSCSHLLLKIHFYCGYNEY